MQSVRVVEEKVMVRAIPLGQMPILPEKVVFQPEQV
jgi:hypothetical protein